MKNINKGFIEVISTLKNGEEYFKVGMFNGESVCNITTRNLQRAEANAQLIAEAFNVHNETGLSPMELKEQRDELLEAIKTLAAGYNVPDWKKYTAKKLINKIENNG